MEEAQPLCTFILWLSTSIGFTRFFAQDGRINNWFYFSRFCLRIKFKTKVLWHGVCIFSIRQIPLSLSGGCLFSRNCDPGSNSLRVDRTENSWFCPDARVNGIHSASRGLPHNHAASASLCIGSMFWSPGSQPCDSCLVAPKGCGFKDTKQSVLVQIHVVVIVFASLAVLYWGDTNRTWTDGAGLRLHAAIRCTAKPGWAINQVIDEVKLKDSFRRILKTFTRHPNQTVYCSWDHLHGLAAHWTQLFNCPVIFHILIEGIYGKLAMSFYWASNIRWFLECFNIICDIAWYCNILQYNTMYYTYSRLLA